MIDFLIGTIKKIDDCKVSMLVNGVGFCFSSPRPQNFSRDKAIEVFTYLHWNEQNGPSLFGFSTEFERSIFILVLECPTIGPKISLTMLASLTPQEIVNALCSEDVKTLSSISGIGQKKAEHMVVALKRKVTKLLQMGVLKHETRSEGSIDYHMVSEALLSLGYTRHEISSALTHLSALEPQEKLSFDLLMRKALAHLSSKTL